MWMGHATPKPLNCEGPKRRALEAASSDDFGAFPEPTLGDSGACFKSGLGQGSN